MLKLSFVKKYQPFVILSGQNPNYQQETNYICGIPYKFIVLKLELLLAKMP